MTKPSKQDLIERIEFLENVIECLPVGILVLDHEGKILLTNNVQEKTSRIKRKDIVGEIFHEKWKELLSREELGEKYWDLFRRKIPYEYVFHDLKPQFFDVKISGIGFGSPLSKNEGFILLHHLSDKIKEDKHALSVLASNLSESRKFLQNIVDSSPNAILSVALDGTIRSANKTASRIFGYSKGDLLWNPVALLFQDKLRPASLNPMGEADSVAEIFCQRENGEAFPARVQVSDIKNEEGEVYERLLTVTDISREKELEERLAISEKLAIYSELIAGIFHQINNPLVGVVNFSSVLLEKMDEGDANRNIVETIHDAARQCQRLITSLMKGFREPESTFNRIPLQDILEHSIAEAVQEQGGDREDVRVLRQFDHLPEVMGDVLQLHQVFRNFLDNAFQSMSDGGKLEISSAVAESPPEVTVRIRDTGCGIPKENLAKIFTPFFTTKKNTGGGLGLSFAFQVIKSHSGRIEVDSTPGEGTVFSIILPYLKPIKMS